MAQNAPTWRVIIQKRPRRVIERMGRDDQRRIREETERLAQDPFHRGTEQVTGTRYRKARVGDWRIIYSVEQEELIVLVVKVGPRGEVYRHLP